MQTTLNNVISRIIDYRGKTPLKLGYNWVNNGKYIALSAKNVKTGKLVNLESAYHGDEKLYKLWMKEEINRGDILLTSEAPFGQVYFWDSDEKIILSQRLFCLTPTNIVPQYLYYYMCSDSFQNELLSRSTGSTVTGLRQPALLACSINVPNTIVQQHIVGAIGSVDDLIEKNEEIIERIIAFSKLKFDSVYESTKTKKLGKNIKFVKGKQASISVSGPSKGYLTIEALTSDNSDVVSSEGVLCKENDVLMVMDGASSGRCYIGNDGYVGSTLARIDANGINPVVLFFALEKHEKEIAEHTTGSAIPHADKSFVSELLYPIVDAKTASSFERLISLVVSKRKENLRLKAIKTAFLAKFF